VDEDKYINRIQAIRASINSLIDELWEDKENQNVFIRKETLKEQIMDDILFGYENEK